MHAAKLQRYGFAALVTALATLLVISGLFYRDWKRYKLAFEQTNQARRILTLNQSLINRLRDAETGQRGFLLTGRPEYLEPYNAALERLPAEQNELLALTAETPEQRRRFLQLQSLATDKLAELRQTIELRRVQGLEAALAVVQTDQGKRTMDRIRGVSQQIEATENENWLAAWNDLRTGAQRTRIVTLLGAILLAALVGGAFIALTSAAGQMERLVLQADEAKRSSERTRDLLRATLYSIGDGVITTDREGAVQMMNAVAERLTGFRETDARGRLVENVFNIVNESSRQTVENPIRRVLRDGNIVGLANHTVLISKREQTFLSMTVARPSQDRTAPRAASSWCFAMSLSVNRLWTPPGAWLPLSKLQTTRLSVRPWKASSPAGTVARSVYSATLPKR